MKTLFKILAGLAIVLAIALTVGILNLDKGIKAAVENIGPELTKSTVTLNDVELSLKNGQGSLSGLSVGNPAGFKTDNALSLGKIALAVDTTSVTSDTIIIETLHIIAPEITYEQGKGGSNIDQLQRNVQNALGAEETTASSEGATDQSEAKKLIIKDLQITGGKISYSNALLGSKVISVPLPDIKMTNIGEKSNGATAAEVVGQILGAINKNTVGAITNAGVLKNLSSDAIEEGKSKLEGALGGFKGLLKKDDN